MTQDAIVVKTLSDDMAEVVVTRTTACGSNCGSCESCIFQNELKTQAKNLIGAKPGQRVVIESKSSKIYGAALLVYIMPIIMFLAGYVAANMLGKTEEVCILFSFAALLLGGLIIVLSQRLRKNKKPITFDIVQFQ